MPLYIAHTRQNTANNCLLLLFTFEGYECARVWRTRIMRISLAPASYDCRTFGTDFLHLR